MGKKISSNIFKKGNWCPLFGFLPRFEDEPPNSIKNRLIDIIYEGREFWGIGEPDAYQQLYPDESTIKWTWGISPQEIKDARLIYITFTRGSMYSKSADYASHQTGLLYVESRMAGIAGVKSKFKGIRVYSLLAICNAAGALVDILHRHEDEAKPLILHPLSEAQALISQANEIMRHDELSHHLEEEEENRRKAKELYQAQSKGGVNKAEKERPTLELRNKYIQNEAEALKERKPKWGTDPIAKHLAKAIKTNPGYKWEPIGFESIKKIIREIINSKQNKPASLNR